MKKGGAGVGSASILLIFAVLCLEVFSVISLSTARADKIVTDKLYSTITEYYQADLLAERVLETILSEQTIPASACGVDIVSDGELISFYCPVNETRELYVEAQVLDEDFDILEWRVIDMGEWVIDDEFPVWTGD